MNLETRSKQKICFTYSTAASITIWTHCEHTQWNSFWRWEVYIGNILGRLISPSATQKNPVLYTVGWNMNSSVWAVRAGQAVRKKKWVWFFPSNFCGQKKLTMFWKYYSVRSKKLLKIESIFFFLILKNSYEF